MNRKKTLFGVTIVLSIVFLLSIIGILVFDGVIWFVYPEKLGYTVKGIDVSRYQGAIDWETISLQEIRFAFIKATEGSSYNDPMFSYNIISSRQYGIYASAYHFFSSKSSGKAQAENFISTIAEHELDMPPILDFEISKKEIQDIERISHETKSFLHEIENCFGIKPIIYTTYESYNAFLANDFNDYMFWFRDLFSEPKIMGKQEWLFWQYCNRGRLNGIDKQQRYVDLNVFKGDFYEFDVFINESKNLQNQ